MPSKAAPREQQTQEDDMFNALKKQEKSVVLPVIGPELPWGGEWTRAIRTQNAQNKGSRASNLRQKLQHMSLSYTAMQRCEAIRHGRANSHHGDAPPLFLAMQWLNFVFLPNITWDMSAQLRRVLSVVEM
ncbi:hypothetical protein GN244_ATG02058 [Phytophthora infestans]|uniref:Uncharacterized protein n=1 Tax=Phytophthora infestans TaxID=4787 RepID=A0A833T9A8_PHYIN|nr:hypothetical protein GN244_ATG02058 [Phytophthora infestans]